MSLGIAITRGGGVNTLYFVYDGTHIRNLFLLRVVNNIALEEGSKLQNGCDVLIVVTEHSKVWN